MESLKNYVSSLREAARSKARIIAIAGHLEEIGLMQKSINMLEKQNEETLKDVKRYEYELSKLDDNNPDKETLENEYNKAIERANKAIEDTNKTIKGINENIEKENEKIDKIESGETKMNLSMIDIYVKEELEVTRLKDLM